MKKPIAGIDPKDMDTSIRPQDDFYHFACGGWLKKNPIPKTEVISSSFHKLHNNNREILHNLFEEFAKDKNLKKGSTSQYLRDFYLSGMDEEHIEKLELTPLHKELEIIDAITDVETLQEVITRKHQQGGSVLWNTFVDLDDKNNNRHALWVYQGNLGLPERDYYLSQTPKLSAIREQYHLYIEKMLAHLGVAKRDRATIAGDIIALETMLARASMSAQEQRDIEKLYNKKTLKELQALTPTINWKKYFNDLGIIKTSPLIVGQVSYMKKLNGVLKKTSIATLQHYLRFRLISGSASFLTKKVARTRFEFYGKTIAGLKEMKPRWQRVYETVEGSLTEAVGVEYKKRYFSKKAEQLVDDLILHLIEAYHERIKNVTWMSAPTKKKALKKLSTFTWKIGGPKKQRSYKGLTITPHDYLGNVIAVAEYETRREFDKLNKPIDREEWHMGAHAVNAYYWPNQNEIVFPAGILQPPFFDESGDPALNYGSIGTVIGHELTHGFDDKGSLFDHNGNLKNWWTKEDREAFMKRTKILVQQYNTFPVDEELSVNGKLTLGENIADLGGVILGYHALQKYMADHGRLPDIDGYTPEQRFFLGLVLFERGQMTKEMERFSVISDPHAPFWTRINGPLAHFQPFYDTFGVEKDDGMYREPKKRADIW